MNGRTWTECAYLFISFCSLLHHTARIHLQGRQVKRGSQIGLTPSQPRSLSIVVTSHDQIIAGFEVVSAEAVDGCTEAAGAPSLRSQGSDEIGWVTSGTAIDFVSPEEREREADESIASRSDAIEYMSRTFGTVGSRLLRLASLKVGGDVSDDLLPTAVILEGQTGSGKTYLCKVIARLLTVKIFSISLTSIARIDGTNLEVALKKAWDDAVASQPCIVVFDQIDLMFANSKEREDGALVNRMCRILRDFSDDTPCDRRRNLFVIGTCWKTAHVNDFVRKLFQDEYRIEVPQISQRKHAFLRLLEENFPQMESDETREEMSDLYGEMSHGFWFADVASVCALARQLFSTKKSELDKCFREAFDIHRESLMRSRLRHQVGAVKIHPVKWDDIGGLQEAKVALEQSIIWGSQHADKFAKLGVAPVRGVLLSGPPGTGKTMLAKAVATESSSNFLPVSISDLVKAEVGESEKMIAETFRMARLSRPCVIFFDEIDSLFQNRSSAGSFGKKLITQLMVELDRLALLPDGSGVFVLGATNHVDVIDKSLLRPGRFDKVIHIPAPDSKTMCQIFLLHVRHLLLCKTLRDDATLLRESLQSLCESPQAAGLTGADVGGVCRLAAMAAMGRLIDDDGGLDADRSNSEDGVTINDLNAAVRAYRLRVNPSYLVG